MFHLFAPTNKPVLIFQQFIITIYVSMRSGVNENIIINEWYILSFPSLGYFYCMEIKSYTYFYMTHHNLGMHFVLLFFSSIMLYILYTRCTFSHVCIVAIVFSFKLFVSIKLKDVFWIFFSSSSSS